MPADPRTFANLIRYGTIVSVDYDAERAVVQLDGLTTAPLKWSLPAAGSDVRVWSPPSVGEQVSVSSPNGDVASGHIEARIPSNATPKPIGADKDSFAIAFGDGAILLYNRATHVLRAALPAGGRVEMEAPGGFSLKGDLEVDGKITTTQNIESDADVLAGEISLKKHRTPGITSGSAISPAPVP